MVQSEDLGLEIQIEDRSWDGVSKVVHIVTLEEYVKCVDDVWCVERACILFYLKEDLFNIVLCALH